MKAILFLASLALAALAGPHVVHEFYHRVIAVTHSGLPLDELYHCPSCRERSVMQHRSRADFVCHGCGHAWLPRALPGFSSGTE